MTLKVLAAGSLKRAFVPLLARFSEETGIHVETGFGPAGLLRERIEAAEPCSLFASANTAHPQALLAAGRAQAVHSFAGNRLNLTARRKPKRTTGWHCSATPHWNLEPPRPAVTRPVITPGSFLTLLSGRDQDWGRR